MLQSSCNLIHISVCLKPSVTKSQNNNFNNQASVFIAHATRRGFSCLEWFVIGRVMIAYFGGICGNLSSYCELRREKIWFIKLKLNLVFPRCDEVMVTKNLLKAILSLIQYLRTDSPDISEDFQDISAVFRTPSYFIYNSNRTHVAYWSSWKCNENIRILTSWGFGFGLLPFSSYFQITTPMRNRSL